MTNVSLGLYAEAVQKDEYRDAKVKTLLETLPEVIGPDGEGPEFDWKSPSGKRHHSAAVILISNNKYRLGKAVGSGTRPKIDDRKLGIVVLATLVGARGLGSPVLESLNQRRMGRGIAAGLAIVAIAVVLDRIWRSMADRDPTRRV